MDNMNGLDPKYLALIQAGLGILAGNNGRQPAGAAIGQGLLGGVSGYQEALRQQQINDARNKQFDFQQKQFDTQQSNRVEDRGWRIEDRNAGWNREDSNYSRNRSDNLQDKEADREFQRIQGKEQFGRQLTLQEKQFAQQYQMQRNAQGFQAGQQARGQEFSASENEKERASRLQQLQNKPARGMSVAAQKELIDTEDASQGSKEAVKSFNKALQINNKAMGGLGSGTIANIGSILPDAIRPNAVDATKELDNVLQGSALPQLKAIFGGMPTEGERAILLEVQGSSSQPAKVREGIFNRAIEAANKRIQYNTEKSKQLRNGTYFTEDGGVNIPDEAVSNPSPSKVKKYNPKTGRIE